MNKTGVAIAISAILTPVVLSQALDDQTSTCILAMPAQATVDATCLDKPLLQLHIPDDELVNAGAPASTEMPPGMQLSDLPPAAKHYQPADVCPNVTLALSASACPDKAQAPLHLERKEPEADLGTDDAFQPDVFQAGTFQTARPQFFENSSPVVWSPAQRGSSLVTVLTPSDPASAVTSS